MIAERDGAVLVHDRYRVYDSTKLGTFIHQLCCQHILRDLDGAAEVYPDAAWPTQIARALRALIHHANLARAASAEPIAPAVRDQLVDEFRHGVRVGLSDTTSRGDRPGETKARCLLEDLRDREADVLRFAHDLRVPPTSNQAERDLRPAKIQQNISGRLTSEKRTEDRYRIRGYLSTAVKHGHNALHALREAISTTPGCHPTSPGLPTTTPPRNKFSPADHPCKHRSTPSEGLAEGKKCNFAPNSYITIGLGGKGFVMPDDWFDVVKRFLNFDVDSGEFYAFSEQTGVSVRCEHGRCHLPPWLIPLILDAETSELLPRTGVQLGRGAFFDLAINGLWGGLITGDKVEIDWSECPCGRTTAHLSEEISRFSVEQGGTDKISCTATPEAHSDAMDFLTNF